MHGSYFLFICLLFAKAFRKYFDLATAAHFIGLAILNGGFNLTKANFPTYES
jgi:hypothetical protein